MTKYIFMLITVLIVIVECTILAIVYPCFLFSRKQWDKLWDVFGRINKRMYDTLD